MSLLERLPIVRGSYREGADLSKTNWFNVGGNAEILFRPADENDLQDFLQQKSPDIPVTILGVGSNLLVRDGGIDGVVIRLGRGFTDITCHGNEVHAGAGALSFNVAMATIDYKLANLEFLCGIPGTIGGALRMNAGAYHGEIASILLYAEAFDEGGSKHRIMADDFGFVYRGNTLPAGVLFTKAVFKGEAGDPREIQQKIQSISEQRQETQPIKSRTSGSTFKNPPGKKAWQLIDEAGCRGLKRGGAQVSEKHCNFFINTGNATANDIEMLGEDVRRRVKEKTGVSLEWEIQMVGKELSDD